VALHDHGMDTIVVLNKDQMGHGDRVLGQKVLGTFLKKSIALKQFTAIVLFNSGVQLVAEGSPVLAELRLLEERGVDVIPCGTCLNHYGVTPAVGEVSDMDTIVQELDRAAKVITI
jgi:intracellular sulfur oxidation DsrE/DsrF family protein